MTKYFYAPAMAHPYWVTHIEKDWPNAGDETLVAMNSDADTDMGNLYDDEFERFFPEAFEISRGQYEDRTIDPKDGILWAVLVKRMSE